MHGEHEETPHGTLRDGSATQPAVTNFATGTASNGRSTWPTEARPMWIPRWLSPEHGVNAGSSNRQERAVERDEHQVAASRSMMAVTVFRPSPATSASCLS